MHFEENIKTLNYFGLTCNQAKVYLALGSKKFFTAREVQKKAQVPRQEIYKILYALKELGFVERTISRPLRFKGISVQQGLSFLLKQKIQETKKMKKKAEDLIENYHQENSNDKVLDIKPHFVLISKNQASIIKRREEIDNAQTNIDLIGSWKRFSQTLYIFGENAKKALERDVKMRVILEKPKNMNDIPEEINYFKQFSNFQLKYILDPPKAVIEIFDKKEAMIKTSVKAWLTENTSLWTDNPCLISIISDYFELMWIKTMEHIPKQICY